MCGIAGSFYFKSKADPEQIAKMTASMAHRGPDSQGIYINGKIAFGHRRLSIIDLSEKSNQPLFDPGGRFAIIFNGEIYNYQEIKKQLPGFAFQTDGDGEVVLAAYITWGQAALQKLKGMFAFAIWDNSDEKLFIARDRLGVKPVYYYKDQENFLFASEIRSLLASGVIKREISREALGDYLAYQSFQSPQTIIKNVFELPAGTCATLSSADFSITAYWKLEDYHPLQTGVSRQDILKSVHDLLLQSVQRRMVSDVPVAAFLSGGIDSSVVVGLMAQVSNAPQTFNIAFSEKDFDESEYAWLVAKKFNTNHHEILLKPEVFLDEMPHALDAMDSPSGDGINTYVVSKAIRQHGIKVALSGVGGDELFAGYPIFRQWKTLHARKAFWKTPAPLRNAMALAMTGTNGRKQRIGQLLRAKDGNISSVYPILRQVNSDAAIVSILAGNGHAMQLKKSLSLLQNKLEKFPVLSQLSIAEYIGYTRQTLLKDTDQMSMATSLEVREPFFDHELIEYVMSIPDHYKEGNIPKPLLIEATGDLIPPEIYLRAKKGFVFPWKRWLKNEMKDYCQIHIISFAQRDIANKKGVEKLWEDFLAEKNHVGYSNILMLVALENYIAKHSLV